MIILGLDISTKTIGISILDFTKNKCKIVYLDHYHPTKNVLEDKEKDFLNTLKESKKHILNLIEQYKPNIIGVEDYIRFLKGGSGSSTIIPLGILNRTICLAISENYPNIPLYICNIISIRTNIKKKIGLDKLPDKLDVPFHLENLLNIKLPIINKRNGKLSDEFFDRADGVAVAYYCKTRIDNSVSKDFLDEIEEIFTTKDPKFPKLVEKAEKRRKKKNDEL